MATERATIFHGAERRHPTQLIDTILHSRIHQNKNNTMPSPIKESAPSLPPPAATTLHPPPSPGTHRALRKLHSAHNLGAKAYNLGGGPSLISQQRQQQQQQHQQQRTTQRSLSPTRRNVSNSYANPTAASVSRINDNNTVRFDPQQHSRKASSGRSPQRGRTNGDAPVLQQQTAAGAVAAVKGRRPGLPRRSAVADELSLERLIPHGPPDGDVTSAIESMRYRVLHDGIKSNTEGMVSTLLYPALFWASHYRKHQQLTS